MNKKTCVIIDDDSAAISLLRGLVKQHNDLELVMECEGSTYGALAIAKYKPDLIFLDLNMPGLDGYEMLEVLDYFPKVIVVTGNREYKSEEFQALISGYIYKPVESKEIFDSVVAKALKN